ncbi:hypothetical protein Pan241w_35550 [Gimesia alba]|uniref:Uncharacterized protein n=1 Tax=Gimesia alba TaxID=2527973 RepID=A0A517RHU9_9PLAN|nr:hypothetical protein [Gimesia alba]QDT43454.1 hypothetical protein Pan241w_35550 [Gimesia alba]
MTELPPKVSFEEFKLFYETTERVTDRRLDTNRWNYSVCLAMFLGIALTARWALVSTTSFIPGIVSVVILATMAIVFCRHWLAQIGDFKSLNNAKFDVLAKMAPLVVFESEQHQDLKSFLPFDKEWERLQEIKALQQPKALGFLALKSSGIEYFIPKAFIFIYILTIISGAITVICVGVYGILYA